MGQNRVITYIDGFNLYFGLKDMGWKRFYWLDLSKMIGRILRPGQTLVNIKYFTSRVTEPKEKFERQSAYLGALGTLKNLDLFYGRYQVQNRNCRQCGYTYKTYSEKMTDVNLAVEMTADAYEDRFDTALLVCADADLMAPISKIKAMFPGKRIVAIFPPGRYSYNLSEIAHAHLTLGRANIAHSQFPDEVKKADGYVLKRPMEWK